ncbi:MFS transporter [Medicago truncatula]|uniref:MFS transporter n=1 Tax=Medicago truncatula TaxID=3880 RepID=G7KI44_MEDTR|nr:MFS transporter [Medicago truncatula]
MIFFFFRARVRSNSSRHKKFLLCKLGLATVLRKAILRKIYPAEEVDAEIQALQESVAMELKEAESSEKISMMTLLKTTSVRRGLYAGMGLQIFQQFVGINIVMYFSPTIVQLAGFASNQTAMLLSLITAGLNTFGSLISIYFIDKTGRKKLALISLFGVVLSLVLLTVTFRQTETHSPMISEIETYRFNNTCPAFTPSRGGWDCTTCLKASPKCGFCASDSNKQPPKEDFVKCNLDVAMFEVRHFLMAVTCWHEGSSPPQEVEAI